MRGAAVSYCLFISAVLLACLDGCDSKPYTTPGTLYVTFPDPGATYGNISEVTEIRGGRVIGRRPRDFIVARDRPDRWLVLSKAPVCTDQGPREYEFSPDGSAVLCSSNDTLRIYDYDDPRRARVVLKDFPDNANGSSYAWLDDAHFDATVIDHSCPYSGIYDFFPTRVETFDRSGRRLAIGPCALGVVAGKNRVALVDQAPNDWRFFIWQLFHDDDRYYNDGYDRFHLTWSVDGGKTWRDGTPLVFDGNDQLLYAPPYGDGFPIKSESGQTVFANAFGVQWSR